jgi:excisionase family DNA binding protein
MARLLDKPIRPKVSKAEAAGRALTKLRYNGSLPVPYAADYLGVHKYTLREFIDKGFIDSLKVGSRLYIEEAELMRVKVLIDKFGSLAKAYKESSNENPGRD